MDQLSDLSSLGQLQQSWSNLDRDTQVHMFLSLDKDKAQQLFSSASTIERANLIQEMPAVEQTFWLRLLEPDDAADVIQEVEPEERQQLLDLIDDFTRHQVVALLAHAEDDAGGLMNPRFSRVRPDLRVDEALAYIRRQAGDRVMLYYIYVLDSDQRLQGVVSLRKVFASRGDQLVSEIMSREMIWVDPETDQERVSYLFGLHDLVALPVLDNERRMQGIITVDDIIDVIEEEATEDAQKFGGLEALDEPYLQASWTSMLRKRGGWLAALFVGEMLTATAMGYFQDEIEKAVILALFIPLIISSGGNSGSQASTLVIRAMALSEVGLKDWWRVMQRELVSGLLLGTLLGIIGFIRVTAWHFLFGTYGEHWSALAMTVGLALIGVVLFGTLSGSMLPFVLRKLKFDPASASAPFVATLVDVTGLIIYFSVAHLFLSQLMK